MGRRGHLRASNKGGHEPWWDFSVTWIERKSRLKLALVLVCLHIHSAFGFFFSLSPSVVFPIFFELFLEILCFSKYRSARRLTIGASRQTLTGFGPNLGGAHSVCGCRLGVTWVWWGGRGSPWGRQFEASTELLRNNGMIQLRGETRDYWEITGDCSHNRKEYTTRTKSRSSNIITVNKHWDQENPRLKGTKANRLQN